VVSEVVVVVDDAPPLARLVVVGARKSSDEPGRMRRHSDPGDAIYTARDKPGSLALYPTDHQHRLHLLYEDDGAHRTRLTGRHATDPQNSGAWRSPRPQSA
jgi:hypothetical protein